MQQEEGDRTLLSPPHPPTPPQTPPPTPTPNPHPTRRSAWQVWRKIHINAHCQAEKQSIKRVVTYDWGQKQTMGNQLLQPDTLSAARESQQGNESTINQRKQEMIWGQRREYQWTDRTHQDLYQRETHQNSQFEQKNEHLGKWLCV